MENLSARAANRLLCVANHVGGNFLGKANLSLKSYGAGSSCPKLSKGVLRLYNMRFCPYAQRTRLVLEHKKIPYETVNIDLKHKPDWFLEKNPMGLVPVLEKDGQIVYESTATCEWLDDMYPDYPPRLQPDDPNRKAWDRILLENFGSLAGRFRTVLFKPETRQKAVPKLQAGLQYYEDILALRVGPLFGGSEPAMIDFYLWPHMERVPAMATVDPILSINTTVFPHLAAWFDAMYQLPAVKETMFDIPTHLHFMKTLSEGAPDYDYNL